MKRLIHFTISLVIRQHSIPMEVFTTNMANNTRNTANELFINLSASPFDVYTKAFDTLDLLKLTHIRYPGAENGGDGFTC